MLAIYARSGGKTGAHCWQRSVATVGLISYVVMQVYEPSFLRKFRAVHHDLAYLQTYRFILVPCDYFLIRLSTEQCSLSPDGRTLELDQAGYNVFTTLSSEKYLPVIIAASKRLTKARRTSKDADIGDVGA